MPTYAMLDLRPPPSPPWRAYRKYQFPGEAVVHRVVTVRSMGPQVHDEMRVVVTPFTGCGLEIGGRAMTEHLEAAGFRDVGAVLTCLSCASGLSGDGDRIAQFAKERLFGAMYGVDTARLASQLRQWTNRSVIVKQLRQRAAPVSRLVKYCYADAARMLGLFKGTRARMRPFSREFRRRLARRLLP